MNRADLQELSNLRERTPGVINIAQVAIVLSLSVLHAFGSYTGGNLIDVSLPAVESYIWITLYSFPIMLSVLRPGWQRQSLDLPNAGAVVDIVMIMVLAYIFGGTASGFGILVLPSVATSCLLSYGHYSMLYAGYTAMLLILNLLLDGSMRSDSFNWDVKSVANSLTLIGASYLVAILTPFAARYLKQATESASRHQLAYRRTNGLNHLVLNRVQETVVVIDATQCMQLFNKQAKIYFPSLIIDQQEIVFGELVTRWQRQSDKPFEANIHIFQHAMHVRAAPLIQEQTELLMLYVCSLREMAAEAMSTKLTSLGQLTVNPAHEIRNPTSVIRHASDLLQEGDEADPLKAKFYNIIDSDIQRIGKMLEDVSLINKRDNISRQPANLVKFWLELKQELTLNNPDATGCLRMNMGGDNLTILVNPIHLQQVMWNLCNNAWRHSRQNESAIAVLIRPSSRMHISIVVADNGKGVPLDVRNHLPEPFYTIEKQGTGLGLHAACELAHANMGQLHYHPEMNEFELISPKEQARGG